MTEPTVSVGILTAEKISFDLYGDFSSFGFKNTFSGRYTASLEDDIIVIEAEKETYKVTGEISFSPNDFRSESFLIREVVIGVKFHWEQKENQRFAGQLKLIKEGDKITAVNALPVESYLTSVISSEMSATSSLELLKAHSIISRSWLLAQMDKTKESTPGTKHASTFETENELIKWYDKEDHTLFDVCADDHCQRYQGVTKAYTDKVREAIEETRGIVLTYDEKICDTRYSKSCGGISEAFENVWEPVKHPYLSQVVDYKYDPENLKVDFSDEESADKWIRSNPPAFCNTHDQKVLSQVLVKFDQKTTDFYRWKVEYTQEEISKLIKEKSGIDFGDIVDLIPVERGYSARLIKLKIVGTKKTLTIGKELEIRRILSPSHLYSSAFVVDKQEVNNGVPGKFILTGAGWGHGVGLCQIGAAVMGEMGYSFDEILLHYFRGAKLKKIY
ncbi:MAG: SpoIID/LytB domain-containing protein [Ignavibacteria bacterium]|jgi:SpoIID/LytB domain protein|nr:SpoIID/LytB domain-containing protein [Ignavibacteria bacterium]MCU7498869.1 SpoIID/LytB domain-containing protein [Ignavibacteria bacterium]MCU7514334.1 SpoIID/LytB domain-containing protein [Ignavibacteria bacterium]MCU7520766.1 SpoIID/LytB domain-containing protein [Ignavibacteria bacterium]MCU7523834.1 SpoIID/LytB domain-containing protein [Ignavibacteria bacterium]